MATEDERFVAQCPKWILVLFITEMCLFRFRKWRVSTACPALSGRDISRQSKNAIAGWE